MRARSIIDLVLVLATLYVAKEALLKIASIWTYAGPISLLLALGVATWRLKANSENWGSLGLRLPDNILKTLAWTVAAFVLTLGAGILADSLGASIFGEETIDPRYAGRFDDVPGNLPLLLYWLIIAWIIGGFTEEMLMRGFLFSRVESVLGNMPLAVPLALIFQAIIFGQQHYYYQGMSGAFANGVIGLVAGIIYVASNRNLWPVVIAHGASNTLGLSLIYFGVLAP